MSGRWAKKRRIIGQKVILNFVPHPGQVPSTLKVVPEEYVTHKTPLTSSSVLKCSLLHSSFNFDEQVQFTYIIIMFSAYYCCCSYDFTSHNFPFTCMVLITLTLCVCESVRF
jgi:hypothetical protein